MDGGPFTVTVKDRVTVPLCQWPSLTVFIISAYGDRETECRAFELGAAAFLHKPIDFSDLRLRLQAQYSGGA